MKKINVKGAIVPNSDKWIYDIFDMEATSPKDVLNELNDLNGEPIQVTINSGGGDVYSASEIYTELKDYPGEVETRIVGIAASAASVIAMAGKVKMSPTAELMIHNAVMRSVGDYNAMDKTSEILQKTNKAISAAYRNKTGLSEEELLELMNKETWLTADEAKEKGFVDEIMFENEEVKMVASAPGALPQNVIDKMRTNELKKEPSVTIDDIKNVVSEMKTEILNELNSEPNNEPTQNRMSKLFLNL